MDLNNLSVFIAVVEAGSLSGAALSLGLAKSNVSRRLSLLEAQQGAPLLVRTTRRQQLTEMGRRLYERCQPLLSDLATVQDSLAAEQAQPQGSLRIQIPADFFPHQLAALCAQFLSAYPAIELELEYAQTDQVGVLGGDIAFVLHQGPLPDSDLNARALMSLPQSIYGATHRYRRNQLLEQGLAAQDCLLVGGHTSWYFQGIECLEAVRVNGPLRVPGQQLLLDACLAGLGLAVLTDIDAEYELARGTLVRLDTPSPVEAQTLTLLYRRQYLPRRASVFIDFFQSNIGHLKSRL